MRRGAIMEGFEYSRIPNMPGFYISFNYALCQGSEYDWATFHRVLNKPPVLNMPGGLRIWQSCEYERVTQGGGYA